jgi:hypothetical protein
MAADDHDVDASKVSSRAAGAPPEEARPGTEDPEGQAEAVLEDSEARTADRQAAPGSVVEHRRPEETVDP